MGDESKTSKRLMEIIRRHTSGKIDITRLALRILRNYDKDRVEYTIPETDRIVITDNRNYWITKRKVDGYDVYNVKIRLQINRRKNEQ